MNDGLQTVREGLYSTEGVKLGPASRAEMIGASPGSAHPSTFP